MKKLLLATVAALGLAAAPGIAQATLTWDILTGVNVGSTDSTNLALQANPQGFAQHWHWGSSLVTPPPL